MSIDCKHWRDASIVKGGHCDLLDEQVTNGICERCEVRQPTRGKLASAAHGAGAIVRVTVRRGIVKPETLAARNQACVECEYQTAVLAGIVTTCSICGCLLAFKRQLARESCPIGRWPV